MKSEIRIGTRKSELSIAQTMLVADAIRAVCPGVEPVLVGHSTIGDKILDKPLLAFGGKGVFVSEFEEALQQGQIDLAVHSAKDLPIELADGLDILGALPRGDVRDVLVFMAGGPAGMDGGCVPFAVDAHDLAVWPDHADQPVCGGTKLPGLSVCSGTKLPGLSVCGGTKLPGQPVCGGTKLSGQPVCGGTKLPGQPVCGGTKLPGQPVCGGTKLPGLPTCGVAQRSGRENCICIGTSSLRRKIQIQELGEKLWPGQRVVCENLRGNVLTRLDKLESGQYDGIILAAAGLDRLQIWGSRKGRYQYRYLSPEEMIPAGGQGILAIEGQKDGPMVQLVEKISDRLAMAQLLAERQVLKRLHAGCHEPVGVYCRIDEEMGDRPEDGKHMGAGAQSGNRPEDGSPMGAGAQSGNRPEDGKHIGAGAQSGDRTEDGGHIRTGVQADAGTGMQRLLLTGIYEKDGVRRRAKVQKIGPWRKRLQEEGTDQLFAGVLEGAADELAKELLGKKG